MSTRGMALAFLVTFGLVWGYAATWRWWTARQDVPELIALEKVGADLLTVSGTGTIDGPYRRTGVHAGRPCYQGPGGWRIYWTGAAWEIASGLPPGPEPQYLTTDLRPDGAWTVGEFGTPPAPVVRLGG